MLKMCRLAEIKESLKPIMKGKVKTRDFDITEEYTIGDPENNERLSLLLNKDNHRNEITATILFEQVELQIGNKNISLDFQIRLKLGNNDHIDVYDLEILLVPSEFLEDHDEPEISKEIISCWNAGTS